MEVAWHVSTLKSKGQRSSSHMSIKCRSSFTVRCYAGVVHAVVVYLSIITEIGNETANINTNCLSTMLTATDQKQQKSLKGDITQHHIDI